MKRANSLSQVEQSEPIDVEAGDSLDQDHPRHQSEQLPARGDTTTEDVETIRAERDALLDRVARAQAEFENARKRLVREQLEFKDHALAEALKSLLPSLDSFDWALDTPTTSVEEFRSGIELIRKQLHDALGKLGLRPIPVKNQPFDPHVHEAVDTVDKPAVEENHVAEELRRGYKLGDRLLRPAMVLVSRSSKAS
jgi:molecular chaperone GrpE